MPFPPAYRPTFVQRPLPWRLLGCTAALLLAACGAQNGGAPPADAAAGMPRAQVGVVTVTPSALPLHTELPGRLEAARVAEVRARVSGIVLQRVFEEGSNVRAGQTLFHIDPAPYDAALASARAQLERSQAQLAQAQAVLERYRPLVTEQAISRQEFVNAEIAVRLAQADVALAQAAVQTARLQRNHADVLAPIAGRIGRARVSEGALVGQNDATALATVQQTDPMYVNFTQSANEVLAWQRAVQSGQLTANPARATPVEVLLPDGTVHPHAGRLLFTDLTVDAQSGQVTLRAAVPNPQGQLLPGMLVRVRLSQAQATQAVLLPQQAVSRTPQGDSVMVVDSNGVVHARTVQLGGQQQGQWVVLNGLAAGEQVMVDGFQKLRGPAPVQAVPWQAPNAAPPAAAAQAPAANNQ